VVDDITHDVLFTCLCKTTDSKTLTEASREKYFDTINHSTHLGWIVEILSPTYISNLMLRRCSMYTCVMLFIPCQTGPSII